MPPSTARVMEPTIAGANLLDQFSRELERLASSVEAMQHALSPLIATSDPTDGKVSAALQELDFTYQALANLADVSHHLAKAAPQTWPVCAQDVRSLVTLSELAARLLNEDSTFRVSSGDLDLF